MEVKKEYPYTTTNKMAWMDSVPGKTSRGPWCAIGTGYTFQVGHSAHEDIYLWFEKSPRRTNSINHSYFFVKLTGYIARKGATLSTQIHEILVGTNDQQVVASIYQLGQGLLTEISGWKDTLFNPVAMEAQELLRIQNAQTNQPTLEYKTSTSSETLPIGLVKPHYNVLRDKFNMGVKLTNFVTVIQDYHTTLAYLVLGRWTARDSFISSADQKNLIVPI